MSNTDNPTLGYALKLQTGAVMIALITAGAFVAIPLPGSPVPIVLQNMFVVFTGVVLAPSWAALAVAVYLLLGSVGLPVFSGATGGLVHLAGPTGGFLLGFPLSAALTAWILRAGGAHRVTDAGMLRRVAALAAGYLTAYLFGVPWLAFVADLSLSQAAVVGMLPFLPGDALKLLATVLLIRTLPRSLWRSFG